MLQTTSRRAFLKALAASAGAAAVPTLAGAGQADGKAQGERGQLAELVRQPDRAASATWLTRR